MASNSAPQLPVPHFPTAGSSLDTIPRTSPTEAGDFYTSQGFIVLQGVIGSNGWKEDKLRFPNEYLGIAYDEGEIKTNPENTVVFGTCTRLDVSCDLGFVAYVEMRDFAQKNDVVSGTPERKIIEEEQFMPGSRYFIVIR